jgi:hypothetical protein
MAYSSGQPSTTSTTRPAREPQQLFALLIGVVYTLVGLVGFAVTGFGGFTALNPDNNLLGFAVNPLHNVVHLVIGLLGIALWSTPRSARTYGWLLFVGYAAAFVYGLIAVNNSDLNFLNINGADNGLHIASALAGLAIALWPRRTVTRDTTTG